MGTRDWWLESSVENQSLLRPCPPVSGNAIALRRIQKVHVIMMCAFFFTHFSPVNNKINFFKKRLDKFKKFCGLRPVRREIFNC